MTGAEHDVRSLEPWGPMPTIGEGNHEAELRREVGPGHPLYQAKVTAIAVRGDCDDVLFKVGDREPRYAVVHLTWSSQLEPAGFPTVSFYPTLEDWVENGMKRDHESWRAS